MIDVELILASRNEVTGDIIYTFKQTFPRIILAEVNTHTIAAKNAASSRAIPTLKQLRNILKDPFIPVSIGSYQKGMQAGQEITGIRRKANEFLWSKLRFIAVFVAWLTYKLGAPKQFSNRLVEPWMYVEQLWSSTDVENELMLRAHPAAEPHYEILAKKKKALIAQIKEHFEGNYHHPSLVRMTQTLKLGEWHLPYVSWWDFKSQLEEHQANRDISWAGDGSLRVWNPTTSQHFYIYGLKTDTDIAKAVSAARCAWVSYYMPGEDSSKMNSLLPALLTYWKLTADRVKHLSPLMHVATPLPLSVRVGSHCGWFMFRKELEGEAGGDKVVPSITPKMAKDLLEDFKSGKTAKEIRGRLATAFIGSIDSQLEMSSWKGKHIA